MFNRGEGGNKGFNRRKGKKFILAPLTVNCLALFLDTLPYTALAWGYNASELNLITLVTR